MDSISILEVAKILEIQVRENTLGRQEAEARCPFCGDDSSWHLGLNTRKNVFRCNRCGRHGGVLHLYAYLRNVTTGEAYRELLELTGPGQSGCRPAETLRPYPVNSGNDHPLRPLEDRDQVYRAFLAQLSLTDIHRHSLKRRGLSPAAIETNGYRSLVFRTESRCRIAARLAARHDLRGIPGFYTNRTGEWNFYSKSGILIPVRDMTGRIQGLQIRLDDTSDRKYRWFSSNSFDNGTPAGTFVHFTGMPGKDDTAFLTEGALKADIASHLLGGRAFLAVPGVNCTRYLGDTLTAAGIRKVLEAFDMDKLTKPEVKAAVAHVREAVEQAGITYQAIQWDDRYKGIDDFLFCQVADQV